MESYVQLPGIFVYTKAIGFSKLTSWCACCKKGKIDKNFYFKDLRAFKKPKINILVCRCVLR